MKALKILTKRERVILFSTISIIVFSVLYVLILEPVIKSHDRLNKEIRVTRLKLKKYVQLLAQREDIQSKYGSYGSSLPEESQDSVVGALSEIERIAQGSGVLIKDIRPQNQDESREFSELEIELTAEGQMESFIKFLYNIEHSLFLLHIKNFQLEAKPSSNLLEASFTILQISVN